ncbi:hypothetical protein DL766_003784 [Monosporascus sp. MC13-8B]|uniref:Large ribosomal subunit protein bL21m n=1 Tax=Monosporascus cannonballus TaxID=155416 RepID=A0ABY0HGX2_9PEZI|nr:hypothetical protein DL763_010802 [Monosporascus cannonballus]RYO90261.1 hypothetical protein DL762_002783 [Monosporascus cannonballus]RYP32811.1 hypothetical protein DL766_003784 [Monosporascus sp. MC13-8B]
MSRSLLRSVLELRTPITRLPPPFLLPIRAATAAPTPARTLTTTTQNIDPATPPTVPPSNPNSAPPAPARREATAASDASVRELLPLLRAQPGHYVTAHIHGFPYLVTPGDQVRLPFRMPGVLPGDVLRLDRASVLGSRDYTLKGAPWIDDSLFECRAVVLGTESEPLRVKVKTKRRNRRAQRVTSKHKYTVLRISELKILEP